MANKRIRRKISKNFTYLYETQPGQKIAGNFPNFLEHFYMPDVWVPSFGCRFNTSWSGGNIAFLIGKIGLGWPSLVYSTVSHVIKLSHQDYYKHHLMGHFKERKISIAVY